jgi:hypothetical protein
LPQRAEIETNRIRSESYGWFAPVLEIIRQNVQLHGADASKSAFPEGQRAHTNNESRPSAEPTRKRSNSSGVASNELKRVKKAVYSARDNKDMVQVKQADDTIGDTLMKLDCIIYKHHLMHGTLSECPCAGFNALNISALRHQHLKPSRARGHLGLIHFLERCKRCKEDVVDEKQWIRHRAMECNFKTQKHNGGVAQWARLYLAQYPDALQIPNPCK